MRPPARALALFAMCAVSTSIAYAQDDTTPAATPPELVDAYIAFERQPGTGATLDGEPLYFLGALKVSGSDVSLYRQLMVCRDERMQVVAYGGTYWYSGVSMAQGDATIATLGMTGCDDCGRAVTAEPEPTMLRLPLAFPDAHTARLGDVLYDKRVRADTRDCPAEATE
jgi:hypothetical protein